MTLGSPNGDEGSGLLKGTRNFEPNGSIPSSPPTTCTGFPGQVIHGHLLVAIAGQQTFGRIQNNLAHIAPYRR